MATDELDKLASVIEQQTTADDVYQTAVPGLRLSRFSAPSDLVAVVYEPCLCVVAQGAKEVLLADATYRLDLAQSLLVSVDLPVDARVVEASPGRPYLAVRLALDPAVVGELLADVVTAPPLGPPARALAVTPVEPRLLDAVTRLVTLLNSPEDIGPLAPLVLREITYRVLTGPQGSRLRQIAAAGAPAQRIARAIRWLKYHFAEPLRIEALAKQVRMSPSAFHLHFKGVTAMSPLQYQKRLRRRCRRPTGRPACDEPAPVPEAAAPPGGPPADAGRGTRRRRGRLPRRLREPVAVQPRVPAAVRRPAAPGRGRVKVEVQPWLN